MILELIRGLIVNRELKASLHVQVVVIIGSNSAS